MFMDTQDIEEIRYLLLEANEQSIKITYTWEDMDIYIPELKRGILPRINITSPVSL